MHTWRDGVIICTVTLKTFEASSPMLMDFRPAKSMTKFVELIKSLRGCTINKFRIFFLARSPLATEIVSILPNETHLLHVKRIVWPENSYNYLNLIYSRNTVQVLGITEDVPLKLVQRFNIPLAPVIYQGSEGAQDVARRFVNEIVDVGRKIEKLLKTNVTMIMNEADEIKHRECKYLRDHCH
ncbi:putative inhibitor of apoptosis [Aphis craccivora]|uniref:Putative inhibitor of apoptosis n=1 Tax=Aphis craccivora TaxID=307492 RepID=A0A6G0VVB4_APHCR|nr:putative inhibitor of apoptosis [Aphis craccivora]